jgi:hypothetical protein
MPFRNWWSVCSPTCSVFVSKECGVAVRRLAPWPPVMNQNSEDKWVVCDWCCCNTTSIWICLYHLKSQKLPDVLRNVPGLLWVSVFWLYFGGVVANVLWVSRNSPKIFEHFQILRRGWEPPGVYWKHVDPQFWGFLKHHLFMETSKKW